MSKLNGKDSGGYDKSVMVNASDVERSMLEVALQVARDFPDIRRADGRKSPHMLCAQEALRLRKEVNAKNQQLETLRATNAMTTGRCKQLSEQRLALLLELDRQNQSRWFRLGRWMGFYR